MKQIAGRGPRPKIARPRELLAVVGVERRGVPAKGLAEVMNRFRVTLTTCVGRGADKRATDSAFKKKGGRA